VVFETIRYDQRGKVALIIYDRQERRNAWSVPMYREVVIAIEQANADAGVGAIVLTNDGPVFCAGVDFKAPPEPVEAATGRSPTVASLSMAPDDSWLHLMARSKPMIAAVNGAAIGAGVTQILAADIRMGSESSTYSFPFVSLGLMPEIGATALLSRLVGFGRALDICMTAARLDAAEALRIGLVTRVAPDDQLVDEAVALGERMAAFPSLQVKLTKDLIHANAVEADANTLLGRETQAFITMWRTQRAAKSLAN
jgi:2-(1,2-epoxy-1,2-dihydrophenyl)acetyl-CoA isomerase